MQVLVSRGPLVSDDRPAPGWWKASDGRWYPPNLHPDYPELIAQARLGQSSATPDAHDPAGSVSAVSRVMELVGSVPSPFAVGSIVAAVAAVVVSGVFGVLLALLALGLAAKGFAWSAENARSQVLNVGAVIALFAVALIGVNRLIEDTGTTLSELPGPTGSIGTAEPTGPPQDDPEVVADVPPVETGRTIVNWYMAAPGDCVDRTDSATLEVLDCATAHDAEVMGSVDLSVTSQLRLAAAQSGDPERFWDEQAFEVCGPLAGSYLRQPVAPNLTIDFLRSDVTPLEESGIDEFDITVVCLVADTSGEKLTGAHRIGD